LIGPLELIGLDAEVDVRVAPIGISLDHAFDSHFAEVVVGGKRRLVEVRNREVVSNTTDDGEDRTDPNQSRAANPATTQSR
jgi:hypothetical protein